MLRWHVISAVFWRNVKQFFSGVQGYLFIVVFVTCCAVLTFSPQFFADNLANLDQLTQWFPLLLLFLVPGITMGIWSDEKRQGTDAILFTLPASDFEIVLGKYLSVAAVYTVALLFSTTQLIALSYIGDPDWGVIGATYVGYWLAGLALLSVGMFASSLTSSAALAFVLGDFFCAIPVAIGYYFRGWVMVERWGFDWNLSEFSVGLIPLSAVLYFLFLVVVMLYLNLVVISRRHWNSSEQMWLGPQFSLRLLGLSVGLLSIVLIVDTASSYYRTQVDLTREKLFTLDQATLDALDKVREQDKEVTIEAFISEQVPRDYVSTRKELVGILRQLDMNGGNNINVEFVEVAPNSPQERSARLSGIEPRNDRSEVGGRTISQRVYLGVRVATSEAEQVLPILDGDSAIEYELSRSIALAADRTRRKTIGIVDTDAHFAGPEFEGRRIDWAYAATIAALKKQYELIFLSWDGLAEYVPTAAQETVDAEGNPVKTEAKPPVRSAPDVMLVADPSSLSTTAMQSLVTYVQGGHPTLILADPLPFFFTHQNPTDIGVLNAPRQPRVSMRSPYASVLASTPAPKDDGGRATKLLEALGVEWDNGEAVWGLDNPHPNFAGTWLREYLGPSWPQYYGPFEKAFVWARNQPDTDVFNPENIISGGLKELLFMYPGSVQPAPEAQTTFTPLVTLGDKSGVTPWEQLTLVPKQVVPTRDRATGRIIQQETAAVSRITQEDLVVVNPSPGTLMDDERPVIAAQITGDSLNVVFVCDLDFVSDLYYQQRAELNEPLDNLTFLENAIEVLAGETEFVALRNRRATPRTLSRLETWTEKLKEATIESRQAAEAKSRNALQAEQNLLDEATARISQDQSLSMREKVQQTFSSASNAQRKYDLRKQSIDRELEEELELLKAREQQQISELEQAVQWTAILLAPLPALLLGIGVVAFRSVNERKQIRPERRA